MPRVCWQADPADGSYWLDVALGGREVSMLIDLGMIDRLQRVGLSLEPSLYDSLNQQGTFSAFHSTYTLDASGTVTPRENGLVTAQLIAPRGRQRLGPLVQLFAARGAALVPNRVGMPFFHHLVGCRVNWDLSRRRWCINCP